MTPYLAPLAGGMLLGLSAGLLLLLTGRIAGISGLFGRILDGHPLGVNVGFILGLMAGPWAYAAATGALPVVTVGASVPVVIAAGLLVGFGTRMGSGCTSGHGILGLARLSPRSIVATLTFLVAGIVAATLTGVMQ